MKILVVDDERAVQSLFQQWFEEDIDSGMLDFDFVFSAEEALDYVKSGRGAGLVLILSDINMPGLNGLELLRMLKEQFKHIPVVIITAYGDDYNVSTAKKYGADDFINKPIDLPLLREKLKHYMSGGH